MSISVIKMLLDAGADPEIANLEGENPLMRIKKSSAILQEDLNTTIANDNLDDIEAMTEYLNLNQKILELFEQAIAKKQGKK